MTDSGRVTAETTKTGGGLYVGRHEQAWTRDVRIEFRPPTTPGGRTDTRVVPGPSAVPVDPGVKAAGCASLQR